VRSVSRQYWVSRRVIGLVCAAALLAGMGRVALAGAAAAQLRYAVTPTQQGYFALGQDARGTAGARLATDGRHAPEVWTVSATVSVSPTFACAFDVLQAEHATREAVAHVAAGDAVEDVAAAVAAIRADLERLGVSHATLAKVLEVKPAVVALLLEDPERIPAGPRHTLLRDAQRWCAADARDRELRAARFVPTPVTRLVAGLLRLVGETRIGAVILGGAGLGKSYALHAAAAELPGRIIVIRADTDSRGGRGILRAVATAAGVPAAAAAPSVKAAVQAVRETGGVLAVDEAQLLSVAALEALRAVFDEARVGLVLCATTLGQLLDTRADPLVAPLISRFAARLDLDAKLLAPAQDGRTRTWLDAATLQEIVARQVPCSLDADAGRLLLDAANFAPGHLRRAVNAAAIAAVFARMPAVAAGQRPTADGEARLLVAGEHVRAALAMAPEDGL